MGDQEYIFLGMVFLTVLLLAGALIVPSFGTGSRQAKRMRSRIHGVIQSMDNEAVELMREQYLRKLTPMERRIEQLPGMERLAELIEQSGAQGLPAYRVVLRCVFFGVGVALIVMIFLPIIWLALGAGVIVTWLPILQIRIRREKRMAEFEEQLPEALDVMARALRAGHPFTESLAMAGEEMAAPVGDEFGMTFRDINYGMTVRTAFLAMLQRVPSMSLMAVTTAIMVQRDTGGNMAEILGKISHVVRSRFRFQRRVRTLSAEGRMSAWVLTLVPFVLAGMIAFTEPTYLPMLIDDPRGQKMVIGAFIGITVGVFWLRQLIRIRV